MRRQQHNSVRSRSSDLTACVLYFPTSLLSYNIESTFICQVRLYLCCVSPDKNVLARFFFIRRYHLMGLPVKTGKRSSFVELNENVTNSNSAAMIASTSQFLPQ